MPDLDKTPSAPGPASGGSDWPKQATDTIVGLVDQVKDKVEGPATSVARTVVYGTLAAIVGTAALILGLVLLVRGFDILADLLLDVADIERAGRSTWIAHLVTGLFMAVPGVLMLRKATRPAPAAD